MDPAPRRLKPWTIVAILVGAIVLAGGGILFEIRSGAERAWAAMQQRTRAMLDEARARPASRPVLRGAAEPGNAWDDYVKFAKAGAPRLLPTERTALHSYLKRRPNADKAEVERLVATSGAEIDLLRQGTRRGDAAFPYPWERGMALTSPHFLRLQEVGQVAIAQSRLFREERRYRGAGEVALDVAQAGSDCRRNSHLLGDLVGLGIFSIAIDELSDLVSSRLLPPDLLEQVERELEILDRDWPSFATSLKNESMLQQITLLSEELGLPRGTPSWMSAWRYGFSPSLMRADAGTQMARFIEMSVRMDSMAWSEQIPASEQLRKEMWDVKNPLVVNFGGTLGSAVTWRQRRAQLRLVRVATRFMRDGTTIELEDPFGDKLKSTRIGDWLRIWSRGRDGVDDGGIGDWSQNNVGRDIVLEVPK